MEGGVLYISLLRQIVTILYIICVFPYQHKEGVKAYMGQLPVSFIAENIVCHTVPIGEGVTGCVYQSKRGRFHIFISDGLSPVAQKEVFFHEMYHILNDLARVPYIIGLDMQREEFEKNANKFASIFMKLTSTLI